MEVRTLLVLLLIGVEGTIKYVYHNATFYTLDGADSTFPAIGINEAGIIEQLGTFDEIKTNPAYQPDQVQLSDLHGGTVLPGFIDAHSHLDSAVLYTRCADLSSPPVGTVTDIPMLIDRLTQFATHNPDSDFIAGITYDDTLLTEQRHPTRVELDSVSSDKPVLIFHVSFHMGVFNSKVLEQAGFTVFNNTQQDIYLPVDEEGALTGVIREEKFWDALRKISFFDLPRREKQELLIRTAYDVYLRNGVTTAIVGKGEWNDIPVFFGLDDRNALPLRVQFWPNVQDQQSYDHLPALDALNIGSQTFQLGRGKCISDGSIQAYTAYLSEPYYVPPADHNSTYRGAPPNMTPEQLRDVIVSCNKVKRQLSIHGNGDAAIDMILDAYEEAQQVAPWDDARLVIVHAQMAREDQLDRMAALNVIPSFFSLHVYYWGDRHLSTFLGPERASRISPLASAEKRGIPFTTHTDTPVVPMDPLKMVWVAVTRKTVTGQVLGKEQQISREAAFRAITVNAAKQEGVFESRGTLEVGKVADFVAFEENPLTIDIDELFTLQPQLTVVAGKLAYPHLVQSDDGTVIVQLPCICPSGSENPASAMPVMPSPSVPGTIDLPWRSFFSGSWFVEKTKAPGWLIGLFAVSIVIILILILVIICCFCVKRKRKDYQKPPEGAESGDL